MYAETGQTHGEPSRGQNFVLLLIRALSGSDFFGLLMRAFPGSEFFVLLMSLPGSFFCAFNENPHGVRFFCDFTESPPGVRIVRFRY